MQLQNCKATQITEVIAILFYFGMRYKELKMEVNLNFLKPYGKKRNVTYIVSVVSAFTRRKVQVRQGSPGEFY